MIIAVTEHDIGVLVDEEKLSDHHFIHDNAQTPPVYSLTVFVVVKDFGGKVFRRAAKGFGCVAVPDLLFAQTEIGNLDMAVLVQ